MKAVLLIGLMMIGFAGAVPGQISGISRSSAPTWWVSGGVGTFNGQAVYDGSTSSAWDFGNRTSWQYRASLEKAIRNQSSIGIVGTYVHVPFVYRSITTAVVFTPGAGTGASCTACDAHLDMESLAATFHAGGGIGFHQVLEVSAGATAYRNLKRDSDGAALAPANGNIDGSFLLGYGFGYGLTDHSEVVLVQDYGLVLHESTNLPTGTSNSNTVRTFRIGMRIGFGSTKPGVRRR